MQANINSFWTTFSNAVYAYAGVETISVAAAETQNPRTNIPIAAKRIFARVTIFYVLTIFMVGMLVPSNDPNLLSGSGTAASSPFVIAAKNAGVKVVPSIINAVVLSSAWSAGNSGLFTSSRTLYGIAREGRAPKIFTRVNRFGIPYVAVGFMSLFICLGFMTLSDSASTVFSWLQDLVSVAAIINWMVICTVYLRFYYGMKAQGISRTELPWKGPLQPYAAWSSLIAFGILLLFGGYTVFLHHQYVPLIIRFISISFPDHITIHHAILTLCQLGHRNIRLLVHQHPYLRTSLLRIEVLHEIKDCIIEGHPHQKIHQHC